VEIIAVSIGARWRLVDQANQRLWLGQWSYSAAIDTSAMWGSSL
jgi:hypothetical protein